MLKTRHELQRFAIAGAVGFAVDASLLITLFQWLGWDLIPSRLISFSAAATTTWLMNRNLTFSHRKSSNYFSEWARYIAVNTAGALLNLGIFIWLMRYLPNSGLFPLIALAVAAVIALVFNFAGSKYIAFCRKPAAP